MEQKKTLWIVAAVGVFLLVVLGAALILYSPTSKGTQTVTMQNQKGSSSNGWISLAQSETTPRQRPRQMRGDTIFNPQDMSSGGDKENAENGETVAGNSGEEGESQKDESQKNTSMRFGELTVYAENATVVSQRGVEGIDGKNSNVMVQEAMDFPRQPVPNQYDSPSFTTTIDLKIDTTESSAVAQGTSSVNFSSPAVEPVVARSEVARVEKPLPSKVKETVKKDETKTAVKPAQKKGEAKPAVVKTVDVKPVVEKTQFWVQVTSLSSRKSADAAREFLAENEINADVFTYTDARGRLFYRVRVGPYTTKSEAEYWQGKIEKIDNFKSNKTYIASTKTEG